MYYFSEVHLILFVVDGRHEITSSDRLLADAIIKSNKPAILVINKIDDLKNEDLSYNFYELGFSEQVSLSAQSGRQVGLLLDKIEVLMPNLRSFESSISRRPSEEHENKIGLLAFETKLTTSVSFRSDLVLLLRLGSW